MNDLSFDLTEYATNAHTTNRGDMYFLHDEESAVDALHSVLLQTDPEQDRLIFKLGTITSVSVPFFRCFFARIWADRRLENLRSDILILYPPKSFLDLTEDPPVLKKKGFGFAYFDDDGPNYKTYSRSGKVAPAVRKIFDRDPYGKVSAYDVEDEHGIDHKVASNYLLMMARSGVFHTHHEGANGGSAV